MRLEIHRMEKKNNLYICTTTLQLKYKKIKKKYYKKRSFAKYYKKRSFAFYNIFALHKYKRKNAKNYVIKKNKK